MANLIRIISMVAIVGVAIFLLRNPPAPSEPVIAPPESLEKPPPAPVYGWATVESHTFAIAAGHFTPIPLEQHKGKIRMKVTAEQPVIFGFAKDEKEFRTFLEGGTSLCASSSTSDDMQKCRPAPGTTLFVADSRMEGAIRLATLAELSRVAGGKPNKVTVSLMEWKCVENCAAPE